MPKKTLTPEQKAAVANLAATKVRSTYPIIVNVSVADEADENGVIHTKVKAFREVEGVKPPTLKGKK
jgi:ribosomal protein L5